MFYFQRMGEVCQFQFVLSILLLMECTFMSTQFSAMSQTIKGLPLLYQGKVRDLYEVDNRHLLMVTSDRISAFDVILPNIIPGKGVVLTELSNFWFKWALHLVPNHLQLAEKTLKDVFPDPEQRSLIASRAVIVRKLRGLPLEAIVRGYLIGSAWKDYNSKGMICGTRLPEGMCIADSLPEPLFTPSTKAGLGNHDENVSFEYIVDSIGPKLAEQLRTISLDIYRKAATYALKRGIIIADTKFEFGLDEYGNLVLMDELLTPDSSRFWLANQYQSGTSPPSFDKQFVRDYLETLDWDKTPPGPELPSEIVSKTVIRYRDVLKLITDAELNTF